LPNLSKQIYVLVGVVGTSGMTHRGRKGSAVTELMHLARSKACHLTQRSKLVLGYSSHLGLCGIHARRSWWEIDLNKLKQFKKAALSDVALMMTAFSSLFGLPSMHAGQG
jgi:hypothetical protein